MKVKLRYIILFILNLLFCRVYSQDTDGGKFNLNDSLPGFDQIIRVDSLYDFTKNLHFEPDIRTQLNNLSDSSMEYQRMYRLFGTYEDFKRKFLALKIKEMPDLGLPKASPGLPKLLDESYVGSLGFALTSPISFFYYNMSREEMNKRRLIELQERDKIQRKIETKYNRQNVSNWTGLKEPELLEFMYFCNFNDAFLLQANEWDIFIAVKAKLTEFKKK